MKRIFIGSFIVSIIAIFSFSCKKFVQIDPPRTDLVKSTVFKDDATVQAAINSVYQYLVRPGGVGDGGTQSISFLTALSSDDILNYNSVSAEIFNQFNSNSLLPENSRINVLWSDLYHCIFRCNAILEGLALSTGNLTGGVKRQVEGEAKFFRAFCHFYLYNMFGDVPIILSTDYKLNSVIPRSNKADVYGQIIADLKDAQSLLITDYSFSNNERVRINKSAATAFLARVYLFNEDWSNSETESSTVISMNGLYNLVNLNTVFLTNNREVIFQLGKLQDIAGDVIAFDYPTFTSSAFTNSFVSAFEPSDQRFVIWVNSVVVGGNTFYSAKKYTGLSIPPTEYTTVLRLAEQYLIRAEARVKQNKLTEALNDINVIRNRAGLPPLSNFLTQAQIVSAIEQERRMEFFTEWGHRWFDLKRWNKADPMLQPLKGSTWQSTDVLYPIPQSQILRSYLSQNPGY